MKPTITAIVTKKCQPKRCPGCIAKCHLPTSDTKTDIDFDALLRWLAKYFPKCDLHISGGEPLLLDGIVNNLKKCIDAGHRVTLFTNALKLPEMPELRKLDIALHATHHTHRWSAEEFLAAVKPWKNKPHLICRMYGRAYDEPKDESKTALYDGFNFMWKGLSGYDGYKASGKPQNPNDAMIMVGQHGEVYNCSCGGYDTVGDIAEMTFLPPEDWSCKSITGTGACSAFQTASVMTKINNKRRKK